MPDKPTARQAKPGESKPDEPEQQQQQQQQQQPQQQQTTTAAQQPPGQQQPAQPQANDDPDKNRLGDGNGNGDVEEIPAPDQNFDVEVRADDAGTVVFAAVVRDDDVDVDLDDAFVAGHAGTTPDERDEADPITGDQVEYLAGAADGQALVLIINGQGYAFNRQMVGALKQVVDKTVVGLAL